MIQCTSIYICQLYYNIYGNAINSTHNTISQHKQLANTSFLKLTRVDVLFILHLSSKHLL